jgi:hypothetical protein
MSQGENPNPVPNPIQPVPGPAPVVVQKTLEDRIFAFVPVALMVLVMVAVNRGWLTKDQADAVNKAIPIVFSSSSQNEDGKPSVEVSTGKNAAGSDTVIVKQQGMTSAPQMTADDFEKWLPLIQKGAEILKPIFNPPTPTPIPGPTPAEQTLLDQVKQLQDIVNNLLKPPAPIHVEPKPVPIEPKPTPVDPGGSKIVVTDEQGKPITAATIEAGILFQVGSTVAGANAGWSVSRNGDVSMVTLANNSGYVCYLKPGAWVEFHLTDFGSRQQLVLRITCNQGPQPPPKPVDPIPAVDVKPKPATDLRVFVVYESSQNHSRQQDLILASIVSGKLNETLNSKCSKGADGRPNWRRWDKDIIFDPASPMGKLFAAVKEPAMSKGLPAIVVTCGEDSTIYPVGADATEDSIISVLTCGAS